jgi:hypothetical protein
MLGALTFPTASLSHFYSARNRLNSAFAAPNLSRRIAKYLLNVREAARVILLSFNYFRDVLHCRYGGVIANEQRSATSSSKRTQLLWSWVPPVI